MFMADCGMTTDADGHLSKEDFVKYRVLIEPKNKPLLSELYKIKDLHVIPSEQLLWAKLKTLIKEAIDQRDQNNGMDAVQIKKGGATVPEGNIYCIVL